MNVLKYFEKQQTCTENWFKEHPDAVRPERETVFYMTESDQGQLEVFKCFIDEVAQTLKGYRLVHCHYTIPRFTKMKEKSHGNS